MTSMQKLSYAITMTVFCLTISQLAQGQERQEEEKRQRWNIEVSGALNNYDLWELEASATYQVFRYAGLTLGLWSAGELHSRSFGGTTADQRWRWQSNDDSPICCLALRPSVRLSTPVWWVGRDRDCGLSLALSPGLTLPLPPNRTLQIDYFPNQAGAWTAIRSERVKNHGARWLSAHAQIALCAMIGEHLQVSVGYTCSGFDPYENVRYIMVEGQRLDIERHKLMHSASLAVGICF